MEQIIGKIAERIRKADPYKIILFGSAVNGSIGKDSDVDMLVVTNDNIIPRNYRENIQIYHRISSHIKDIRRRIPVDLIVYTKPMFKKFISQESLFSKEILEKGIILYEKNNKRMVKSGTR
jgi:uncharacterized protein